MCDKFVRVKAEFANEISGWLIGRKLKIEKRDIWYIYVEGFSIASIHVEPWVEDEVWKNGKWVKERKPVHIVVKRDKNATLVASVHPSIHLSPESAINEATRLSELNIDEEFIVLKQIHSAKKEKPPRQIIKGLKKGNQLQVTKNTDFYEKGTIVTVTSTGTDSNNLTTIVGPDNSGLLHWSTIVLYKDEFCRFPELPF